MKKNDSLISTKEAAEIIGCSEGHLRNMRGFGGGPVFVKINHSRVKYRRADVDAWIQDRKAQRIAEIMGS